MKSFVQILHSLHKITNDQEYWMGMPVGTLLGQSWLAGGWGCRCILDLRWFRAFGSRNGFVVRRGGFIGGWVSTDLSHEVELKGWTIERLMRPSCIIALMWWVYKQLLNPMCRQWTDSKYFLVELWKLPSPTYVVRPQLQCYGYYVRFSGVRLSFDGLHNLCWPSDLSFFACRCFPFYSVLPQTYLQNSY